jgi:hypothetical protein
MATDDLTPSGMYTLEGIKAQMTVLTDRVEQAVRAVSNGSVASLRDAFQEHVQSEQEWQRSVDVKLDRALGSIESVKGTVEPVKVKVEEHERLLQQGKGALMATRLLYVVLGALVPVLVWVYTQLGRCSPVASAGPTPAPVVMPSVSHVPAAGSAATASP